MDIFIISALFLIGSTSVMGISYLFYALDWIKSSQLTEKERKTAYVCEVYSALVMMFAYPICILGGKEPITLLAIATVLGAIVTNVYMYREFSSIHKKNTYIGDKAYLIHLFALTFYFISILFVTFSR